MIRHIVMWKFAPEAYGRSKEENMKHISDSLYALRGVIPEIKRMEIGCDIGGTEMSYDMALTVDFESMEALGAYKVHPEHVKVSEYVKGVRIARTTVDYEI